MSIQKRQKLFFKKLNKYTIILCVAIIAVFSICILWQKDFNIADTRWASADEVTSSSSLALNLETVLCANLCSDVENKISTKPKNSSYYGLKKCSSSQYSTCDDTIYYTTWFCNPGYDLSADGKNCDITQINSASSCLNQCGGGGDACIK